MYCGVMANIINKIYKLFHGKQEVDYSASFVDITTWQEARQYQTGGTREKRWVIHPTDYSYYFFKISIKKEVMDYPSEFWMEIIASKIGKLLGLNMLDYNIAKRNDMIGCISKNMIDEDGYALTELMYFLMGYQSTYNPETNQDKFTIQFVFDALEHYGLEKFMPKYIETLLFDCIIGNQDRHQENWGIITPTKTSQDIKSKQNRHISWQDAKVAPIYDSGSSLGREQNEDKIVQMLRDKNMMEAYINRYKPEVRLVEGKKIHYSEMVQYLLADDNYKQHTKRIIEKFVKAYDIDQVTYIVNHIDNSLPNEYNAFKLTDARKKFVISLMTQRLNKLKNLI